MFYMKKFYILLFYTLHGIYGRSVFRIDSTIPGIKVTDSKSPTEAYIQKDSHLTHDTFFKLYDHQYLLEKKLPKAPIIDYTCQSIKYSGETLDKHLQKLVQQVRSGKKTFHNFDIIKSSNFNDTLRCGLLILKHKKMPFVIKLFIEHPETLVHPTWKGIEPIFFFYMGGVNRHFAGFTRIKNKEYINNWVENNEKWKGKVLVPRKWFWLPKDPKWILIEGENMRQDNEKEIIRIPGTYAIIADFFDYKECKKYKKERKNIIMQFCNDINMHVDPHEDNFIITKNYQNPDDFYLAIIDTEHFPTMVGMDASQKITFSSHTEWLWCLALKCVQDIYFTPKSKRTQKKARAKNTSPILAAIEFQ
jgi:hypothetical protein